MSRGPYLAEDSLRWEQYAAAFMLWLANPTPATYPGNPPRVTSKSTPQPFFGQNPHSDVSPDVAMSAQVFSAFLAHTASTQGQMAQVAGMGGYRRSSATRGGRGDIAAGDVADVASGSALVWTGGLADHMGPVKDKPRGKRGRRAAKKCDLRDEVDQARRADETTAKDDEPVPGPSTVRDQMDVDHQEGSSKWSDNDEEDGMGFGDEDD
ncbi:hypothetical protein C8Q80DRAFT_1270083 [Daedaleopsis nitida]|nr:hypothetical protein C8Q80DRAFT_1270083 [Daedaleopsis nitida]